MGVGVGVGVDVGVGVGVDGGVGVGVVSCRGVVGLLDRLGRLWGALVCGGGAA